MPPLTDPRDARNFYNMITKPPFKLAPIPNPFGVPETYDAPIRGWYGG